MSELDELREQITRTKISVLLGQMRAWAAAKITTSARDEVAAPLAIDGTLRSGQFVAPAYDTDGKPVPASSRVVGEELPVILNGDINTLIGTARIAETSGGRTFVRGTLNQDIQKAREVQVLMRQTGVTFYVSVRTRQPRAVNVSAFGDVGAVEQVG